MEMRDLELIRNLSNTNRELKNLYKSHLQYEEALSALDRRPVVTPNDALRKKELQKMKLAGKDRMISICEQHRRTEARRRAARRAPPDLTA